MPVDMIQFPAAHIVLTQAIQHHAFPGAAYGVLLRGDVLAAESAGCFTYQSDSPPVMPGTIFDMASVSKVMATTAMAMLLYERGQFDLDEQIGDRLPEFVRDVSPGSPRRKITARMLLAHSSGLPAYARLFEHCHSSAALLEACLHMPLEAQPETQTAYSDIGFIVLGHLLETIAGERLDSYCQREVFTPLGMNSTLYCPPLRLKASIPPTAIESPIRPRIVQGEVHDDNCYVLDGISGHAGLFSNVADTLRFANCILHGGSPILRRETISLFATPHLLSHCPSGQNSVQDDRALGWDMPSRPSSSGQFFSAHSVGHLGYTGTSLWIDFEKQLAVALLTNRTYPGNQPEEEEAKKIQQVRPRFHDALFKDFR